jgi:spore coat polysaccharide biosynthesis protein SpsF
MSEVIVTRVVAIVQARMGSTRLPNKVMKKVVGQPVLWHVVNRIKSAKTIDKIVVASTKRRADKRIIRWAEENGVERYAGSENDVLDRYYQAAVTFDANVIVRITSDCPLIDPKVIDIVVNQFLAGDFDYVSNTGRPDNKPTYPAGLDTEVFSFSALRKAWEEAKLLSEREHVTPYIWKHRNLFKIGGVAHDEDLSRMRWTLDYDKDLEFVREVYARLYSKGKIFYMEDVLGLLNNHQELLNINKGVNRNEGYLKSLGEDMEKNCTHD